MSDESFLAEFMEHVVTGIVVAIIVVLTIVAVCCIVKNTPDRQLEVTRDAKTEAAGRKTLRSRAAAYYHKYWKVTDRDAPVFDNTRRFVRKYIYGTLITKEERDAEQLERNGIYERSSRQNDEIIAIATTLYT